MAEATALQQAIAPAIEPDDEPDQPGLFAAPETPAGQAAAERRGYSGFGRPPGSRNKRTERTVAYILAHHRDPRVILAEMAEANVFDLAALLGCKPFEAWQEKRLAAIGLLPYVAPRITPEVIDNRQVIHLTIGSLGAGGEAIGAAPVRVLDAVEYQQVSEGEDDKL